MRFSNTILALAATASAQRPTNTPICDYYTTALLKENTAANQLTLLTLLVNTVVIGNYTKPNTGVTVPGILAPGSVNGEKVNLLPYFNGDLASSNRGGSSGVSVNFLDGGGASPLLKNLPANDKTSNQYFLLNHLYQLFGALLGCSQQGMPAFPAYGGQASMYEVHKFMGLGNAEFTYFVDQVALAAQSFGVAKDDITTVGTALGNAYGMRCAAPLAVIKSQGPQLQAICIADDCPQAKNATCSAYAKVVQPTAAKGNSTTVAPTSALPTSATKTGSATSVPSAGAATLNGINVAAVVVGLAALAI